MGMPLAITVRTTCTHTCTHATYIHVGLLPAHMHGARAHTHTCIFVHVRACTHSTHTQNICVHVYMCTHVRTRACMHTHECHNSSLCVDHKAPTPFPPPPSHLLPLSPPTFMCHSSMLMQAHYLLFRVHVRVPPRRQEWPMMP